VLVERNGRCGHLSAQNDVGGMLGRLMFGDAVAERRQVDAGEHRFALPEHDRRQGEMQLIDQPARRLLTYGRDGRRRSSRRDHWRRASPGSAPLDTSLTKMRWCAFHLDRITGWCRQTRSRVIGRVAPHQPLQLWSARDADRPNILRPRMKAPTHPRTVGIADQRRPSRRPYRSLPGTCACRTATGALPPTLAEGFSRLCSGPAPKPVERDRKAATRTLRHNALLRISDFTATCDAVSAAQAEIIGLLQRYRTWPPMSPRTKRGPPTIGLRPQLAVYTGKPATGARGFGVHGHEKRDVSVVPKLFADLAAQGDSAIWNIQISISHAPVIRLTIQPGTGNM